MDRLLTRRLLSCSLVFLAILACFLGAGRPETPALAGGEKDVEPGTTYVGALNSGPKSARIAAVVTKDKVTAYICSGDQKFNEAHARWFKGTLSAAGDLQAKSADGQTLSGKLKGQTLDVVVKAGDKELTGEALADPSVALFRLEDKDGDEDRITGWIVDVDGKIVGAGKTGNKVQVAPKKVGGNQVGQIGANVQITNVEINQSKNAAEGLNFDVKWTASTGKLAGAKITGFKVDLTGLPVNPQDPSVNKSANVGPTVLNKKFQTAEIPQLSGSFQARVTMSFEFGGKKLSSVGTLNK